MNNLIDQLKKALANKAGKEEIKVITDKLFHQFDIVEISFGDYPKIHCGPVKKKVEVKTTTSRK